ncbi:MAG TPA: anti-sigma factor [Solirubrobacteraceae bacterium]
MNGHIECSAGDAAAYVLGALEPYELEPFRDHLTSCAICRDEVAALQVVADMLPSAVPPAEAPRGLRKRVLTTVYDDAQLFASTSASRQRANAGLWSKPRRGRRLQPLTALAATAFLAVGILLGAIGLDGIGSSGPSTRVIQATVPTSSTSLTSAALRVRGTHAELVVAGMAPPPSGEIYEVWVQRGGQTDRTNALFVPATNGAADVDVPGSLSGVSAVMVTAEPSGGTDHPTTTPVILASLD